MISYKALSILTVLFNIIIYCNGSVKECEDFLVKIGFESATGFYNLIFVLQFKDYEEFLQHVKTKIDVNTYNEVISTEKYRYLGAFFTSVHTENYEELENDILKTPQNYCDLRVTEDEKKTFVPVEGTDGSNNFEILIQQLIKKCTTLILEYSHEINGKTFKYDEKNHFKCLLTTYDMVVLNNPTAAKSELFKDMLDIYKSEKPEGYVHHYYLYNIEIFSELFNTYEWLIPSKWCANFFINENITVSEHFTNEIDVEDGEK